MSIAKFFKTIEKEEIKRKQKKKVKKIRLTQNFLYFHALLACFSIVFYDSFLNPTIGLFVVYVFLKHFIFKSVTAKLFLGIITLILNLLLWM